MVVVEVDEVVGLDEVVLELDEVVGLEEVVALVVVEVDEVVGLDEVLEVEVELVVDGREEVVPGLLEPKKISKGLFSSLLRFTEGSAVAEVFSSGNLLAIKPLISSSGT